MGRAARLKASQAPNASTPRSPEAYQRAIEAMSGGNRAAAIIHLRQALIETPASKQVHFAMAMALREQASHAEAVTHYETVIALEPRHVDAMTNLAETFRRMRRLPQALATCERALSVNGLHAEAYLIRGVTRHDMHDVDGAIADLERAAKDVGIAPNALKILGTILMAAERKAEALSALQRASELPTADAEVFRFVGDLCDKMGRLGEAFAAYRRSMELDAHCAFTYANLSGLLCKTKMLDVALSVTEVGIKLAPNLSGLHYNRAVAFEKLERVDEALLCYAEALRLEPSSGAALMSVCRLRGQICDWDGLATSEALARTMTYKQGHPTAPFGILPTTPSLAEILACNRVWARSIDPGLPPLSRYVPRSAERRRERLRIGYLSADFHMHATAALVAELFELRDTSRFEVFGYSIGAHDEGPMRQRLAAALDHFQDLTDLSHDDAAARIHRDEIDVLVDLKGYTFQARPEIMARRPAPIQANFLGYPSTMGAGFIDYIIGDSFVTPFDQAPFYAEKIVHLPHSYQPNDRRRVIAPDRPTRADCGLPDDGFVFCCFNANYKFTPAIFDIWMRLLRDTPRSVLWLYEARASAPANLRREAEARGIDPTRLVFAPKRPVPHHLARMTLGDLFLDTSPVGAHTTASEALWVGLPVLTYLGEGFAARVGASLVSTIGLPDLVATTLEAYETIARHLANDADALRAVKIRLAAAIPTAPLFDTPRYARNLERAFLEMTAIRDAGDAPRAFAVSEPSPSH